MAVHCQINIREFLNNDEDYEAYETYKSQRSQRRELKKLSDALKRTEVPLSAAQESQLIRYLVDVDKNRPTEPVSDPMVKVEAMRKGGL